MCFLPLKPPIFFRDFQCAIHAFTGRGHVQRTPWLLPGPEWPAMAHHPAVAAADVQAEKGARCRLGP